MSEWQDHGGSLAWAEARFGQPGAGWLDLSTGINPRPYPAPAPSGATQARLPEPAELDALNRAAAAHFGAPATAPITAGPGTQTLIQWLPRLIPPASVRVVGPTYGEHARAWAGAGHRVSMAVEPEDDNSPGTVIVVVNPNNPDGRVFGRERLARLARRQAAENGLLIVDEAFADADPETSLAPLAGEDGLVILRSFGKFFGLAGLRLGFALAPRRLAAGLADALGPWAVSGPAIAAARMAYSDSIWIGETRDRLCRETEALACLLRDSGLDIIGGTSLFQLAESETAPGIFAALAERGILCRHFRDHPRWLRFGLPGDDEAARRLASALERIATAPT